MHPASARSNLGAQFLELGAEEGLEVGSARGQPRAGRVEVLAVVQHHDHVAGEVAEPAVVARLQPVLHRL